MGGVPTCGEESANVCCSNGLCSSAGDQNDDLMLMSTQLLEYNVTPSLHEGVIR